VHSEPGAGTRIDGWIPLPDQPTEASEREAAAAGQQSADGVSSAGESASLITSADDTLVGKARDALREALTRYGDAPAAERVRQVLESLDEAPDIEATDAGPPLPPSRRIGILSGWTALRELDALVRSEPPDTGAASLLHRLERISSGAHELAEVDAIDALRSGEYSLTSDDVEHAARLLGEFGEDPVHSSRAPAGDRSVAGDRCGGTGYGGLACARLPPGDDATCPHAGRHVRPVVRAPVGAERLAGGRAGRRGQQVRP
jgi:hypothetical protein